MFYIVQIKLTIEISEFQILYVLYTYIPLTLEALRGSGGISDIPLRRSRVTKMTELRNTADVTGGKFISSVSVINPLVAFFDIHGRKGEVIVFCFVPDTTLDIL
jgi:hypothetical protein